MAFVLLALFLVVVLLAWCGTLIGFMGKNLLRPRRMTDERAFVRLNRTTPADLGLAFDPMGFTVRDAHSRGTIRLTSWWMPAAVPSRRAVIIAHGYGDAKVGGIAWAPTWHELGWNVLAVDLRAHGDSEGADCTAGYFERDDLDQIIDALRAEKPTATETLALFGVSLGAACVLASAVRRDDIAAVILESPYADYREAVHEHVRRMGFPLVHATSAVCRVAEWISGSDFNAVRPKDLIPQLTAPLMVIHGDEDRLVNIPAIADACACRPADRVTRHDVWAGVPHVVALMHDAERFHRQLHDFLRSAGIGRDDSATKQPSASGVI